LRSSTFSGTEASRVVKNPHEFEEESRRGLVCREFGGAAEDDEFGGDVLVPAGKKKWGDFN
jgi:hypothetical protein